MNKIKTIYIAGGGTRGIAFIGALQTLQDQKLLYYCETIIGTSIGAMIGTGLSLNVPLQEMYKIFYDFNLTARTDINIENLLSNFGLDCGKKFLIPFRKTLAKFSKTKNLTFRKHYELTKKKLIITAACVNSKTTLYFDYQRTPNLPIIRAVRMSISVPFFFTSPRFLKKHMVDGSTFQYYPFQLFGDPKTFLGLDITKRDHDSSKLITNIETFFSHLIFGMRKRICQLEKILCKDYEFIEIFVNEPLIDFSNDKKKRLNMYKTGLDVAKKYLAKQLTLKNKNENEDKYEYEPENEPENESKNESKNESDSDLMKKQLEDIQTKLDLLIKLNKSELTQSPLMNTTNIESINNNT